MCFFVAFSDVSKASLRLSLALAPRWLGLHAPRGLRGLGSGLGTAGRGLEERQERSQIDMMVLWYYNRDIIGIYIRIII